MNLALTAITAAERLPLPDRALRFGISRLVGRTRRLLAQGSGPTDQDFARAMSDWPIAVHTAEANAQHYELPAEFFSLVLGPRRKYSSCLYVSPATTLAQAEVAALEETCAHADLADGQDILELGCGWGSLSLFMAERYPSARIVSVSNSSSQRSYIQEQAEHRGLRNLTVITADMNTFMPVGTFDRIVSVEMFEHMSNWDGLLKRIRGWIRDEGRLFLHVFSHRGSAYRFDHTDKTDWIAQYFFTGGVMPSHGLVRAFNESFAVEQDWRWSGRHYERTARDWLNNFDNNRGAIRAIFQSTYGQDAPIWMRRWRLFFLATSGLFGHAGGEEWGVSHFRLTPVGAAP
jgi:cyclopropane-fatty-acyl-phospholipid synthase